MMRLPAPSRLTGDLRSVHRPGAEDHDYGRGPATRGGRGSAESLAMADREVSCAGAPPSRGRTGSEVLVRSVQPCENPRMDSLDTPNCPACLIRMEPADGLEAPVWKCPTCSLVKF